MKNTIILVPTDFTEVANYSVEHAAVMCQQFRGTMVLLHVVKTSEEEEHAYIKLQTLRKSVEVNYSVKCREMVKTGDIFKDISLIAAEIGANMVVMGTHGVSGMQHVFGSRALKVIANSRVPYISVQKKHINPEGYKKIVMPFNVLREPKMQVKLVTDLAKGFGSQIHVIGYLEKSGAKFDKVLKEVLDHLDNNNIDYSYSTHTSSSSFDKHVVNYAIDNGADLIAIANLQGTSLNLFGGFEQSVIGNTRNLPVMVVNQIHF